MGRERFVYDEVDVYVEVLGVVWVEEAGVLGGRVGEGGDFCRRVRSDGQENIIPENGRLILLEEELWGETIDGFVGFQRGGCRL